MKSLRLYRLPLHMFLGNRASGMRQSRNLASSVVFSRELPGAECSRKYATGVPLEDALIPWRCQHVSKP